MTQTLPSLPLLAEERGAVLLGWSEIAAPAVVGLMARSGYDSVLIDLQHGQHDIASTRDSITEATLAQTPALVRVPVRDWAMAARALDLGAAGIVAPMINSAEDAAAFAAEIKYPPLGRRSWGPGRALQAHRMTPGDYFAGANASTAAIAMCETREALAALDDILSVPGVDGILVGPADLSIALSNGTIEPEGTAVREAMREIARRTRARGKLACAFGGRAERAAELIAEGYQVVSVGYDTFTLASAFAGAVDGLRQKIAR